MSKLTFQTMAEVLWGFAILTACYGAGFWLKHQLGLIIPANVTGLFLLLLLLGLGAVKIRWVERASAWLLFILPLLFVPIYAYAGYNKALWREWGFILVGSMMFAVIVMWLTVGHLAQRLLKKEKP
jgi:holin-like protein